MKRKTKNEINSMLKKYNCELIEFTYYEKVFGNIVLKFKFHEKELCFVLDRGDIYCDGKLMCNYEYLKNKKTDKQQKLLEMIELKLREIKTGD
ncbi:MAG: hypothetical protein IJ400_04940 [Clostridia bacterium]|nr:hypothetical protein [Clostridia bacterium]